MLLLMAAEVNEVGEPLMLPGTEFIEQIRSRARNGATGALPTVVFTDQAQMRTAIQNERRYELAMEGERFYDLVRWGLAPTVHSALGLSEQT